MTHLTHSQQEEKILKFWQTDKIFQQSVDQEALHGDYVFYDGPPFATGTPHYGHIVASLLKDAVPRYQTMRGYSVPRRWGWDCHGLPIENIVEKELGIKHKKDIESTIGVAAFNEQCRSKVLTYADEWKKVIDRLGRWVDMDHPYRTMDVDYMESIWWVFKQLWDKDLIYEGYRSMHICPRCETTLSQSEVTEGYKDITDQSAIVKFELAPGQEIGGVKIQQPTYILAWTTTPWTLPGNVALAVGNDIEYVRVNFCNKKRDENGKVKCFDVILTKNIFQQWANDQDARKKYGVGEYFSGILVPQGENGGGWHAPNTKSLFDDREIKGSDLVGLSYLPLFSYFATEENKKKGFRIYAADFVSTEDGTGVVHIAPAFGEDDMNLGKKNDLPFIQHVKADGTFTDAVTDFAGQPVKPKGEHAKTDKAVTDWLEKNDKLFSQESFTHSYPHCYRCDTPLLNYATGSWFVNITKIKPQALKLVKKINWVPEYIKEGRFGNWLEGARDWSISRQRYWGSVMPIWQCSDCHRQEVFGSRAELEKASGVLPNDLHKHVVDVITFPCGKKCPGTMKRIPDVLDCWFESGSMPYAQHHYPFENKKLFEKNFPAQFIAEGADQCRAWFYYLVVLSVALFDSVPFQNVIVNGIVLAQDGQKMSKRLKNYPDPQAIIERYGADALRYYLFTSPVMKADTLNFAERGVDEVYKKLILILSNVLSFYEMFKNEVTVDDQPSTKHVLDQWIVSKTEMLKSDVTMAMEDYDVVSASRPIVEFVNELSTWYVRRSRDRFKSEERTAALATLRYVLLELSKLIAPFTPFIAERVYQAVNGEKLSVHLDSWPVVNKKLIDKKVLEQMTMVRQIVEAGLAARASAGLKIRQPLTSYTTSLVKKLPSEYAEIVTDELNIEKLLFGQENVLDTDITPELKRAGYVREVVRHINALRKNAGLTIGDTITVYYQTNDESINQSINDNRENIIKDVIAQEILNKKVDIDEQYQTTVKVDDHDLWLGLEK